MEENNGLQSNFFSISKRGKNLLRTKNHNSFELVNRYLFSAFMRMYHGNKGCCSMGT